jgi:hypothetical protein
MNGELGDQKLAACWGDVTELEQVFGALRDSLGLAGATRVLVKMLAMKDATWRAERLAVAIAALDEIRRS